MTHTIVSVHAHPDDETLLTGGSLARWHAEGHRTVVVMATDGAQGLASSDATSRADLATVREAELEHACRHLGVDRVVRLGYPDSGNSDPAGVRAPACVVFAHRPLASMAARLAGILRAENAHVVTGYDAAGGYGHPDHMQVHRLVTEPGAGRVEDRHTVRDPNALQPRPEPIANSTGESAWRRCDHH